MAEDTRVINLRSRFKGLKVLIDGGKMDYTGSAHGRLPRIDRPAEFIAFTKGAAEVGPEKWPALKAKDRVGAIDAIRKLSGYGADFFLEGEQQKAGRTAEAVA